MTRERVQAAILVLLTIVPGTLLSQEKKVQRSELPAPVEATVAAQTAGGTVTEISQQTGNGKIMYEVETVMNGQSRDLLIDATGTVVEVEQEMIFDVLPAMAKANILNAAGKGRVLKVESVTKAGQLTGYEVRIDNKGKKSALLVGPNGKPVAAEKSD